jgi:hypothetical protein
MTYRVRVCKTCTNSNVLELGTYLDLESAVLVNDAYLLSQKSQKGVLLLTPEDEPFLAELFARYFHKRKRQVETPLPDVLRAKLETPPKRCKRVPAAGIELAVVSLECCLQSEPECSQKQESDDCAGVETSEITTETECTF